jgi:hypothetical protein
MKYGKILLFMTVLLCLAFQAWEAQPGISAAIFHVAIDGRIDLLSL